MDKIKCIFMGYVHFKVYGYDNGLEYAYGQGDYYKNKPKLTENTWPKNEEKFYECEIEKPPFEIGEKVFIPDLNITIKIKDRIRSINGSIVFKTDYMIKVIEDENTEKYFKEATEKLQIELVKYNNAIEQRKQQPKKWYQFWK